MRNAAGEVRLAGRLDIMARAALVLVAVDEARREDNVAEIEQVLDRPGQFGIGLEQRAMLGSNHPRGIVAIQDRPVGPIDPDDLLGLDAAPEGDGVTDEGKFRGPDGMAFDEGDSSIARFTTSMRSWSWPRREKSSIV